MLSDDLADATAVLQCACDRTAEAYGAEFRLSCEGETVHTSAAEMSVWDPATRRLPMACLDSQWACGTSRHRRGARLRHDLRQLLEDAVRDGLMRDVDALGLRRAAEVLLVKEAS